MYETNTKYTTYIIYNCINCQINNISLSAGICFRLKRKLIKRGLFNKCCKQRLCLI